MPRPSRKMPTSVTPVVTSRDAVTCVNKDLCSKHFSCHQVSCHQVLYLQFKSSRANFVCQQSEPLLKDVEDCITMACICKLRHEQQPQTPIFPLPKMVHFSSSKDCWYMDPGLNEFPMGGEKLSMSMLIPFCHPELCNQQLISIHDKRVSFAMSLDAPACNVNVDAEIHPPNMPSCDRCLLSTNSVETNS